MIIRRVAQWAVSVEVWVVTSLAVACVISDHLLLPAVVVAALFWPLRWLVQGRLSVRTPLDMPAIALVLMLPVTLLATPLLEITLPQVYRLLVGMLLCFAIINHIWIPAGLRGVMLGLVGLGVALSLAALMSVNWAVDKLALIPVGILKDLPRLIGEQVHPNVMAGTLILLVMFGVAWLLFGGRQINWWGRILLILASGFTLIVLVFTQSRGAWIGLAAGLAALIIFRWPRWGTVAVVAIGLAGGLFAASHPGLVQEFINGNGGDVNVTSLHDRVVIWARAIIQIKDFPLTGLGMGTFPYVSRVLYPIFFLTMGDVPHAHNLFLQIAIDLGLPGLAAWLTMAIIVVRCAWQIYRAGLRQMDWLAGMGAGLLAALVALAIHGIVDAATWGSRPAVVVWGLWGLAIAGWLMVRRDSSGVKLKI